MIRKSKFNLSFFSKFESITQNACQYLVQSPGIGINNYIMILRRNFEYEFNMAFVLFDSSCAEIPYTDPA